MAVNMTRSRWGTMPDGAKVHLFNMSNQDLSMVVSSYGATLTSLQVPDRNGRQGEVVLGFDDLAGYLADIASIGRTVGRVANRISRARFRLGGREYMLDANKGAHHIHGGSRGFSRRVWQARTGEASCGPQVKFTLDSPDGDQGYPGELHVEVVYTLTEDSVHIGISCEAESPTVANLTNHTYFNLAGMGRTCLDHELEINAREYLETDSDLIPTGRLHTVKGTPLDFAAYRRIGEGIDSDEFMLRNSAGYDHYFVLNDGAEIAAAVREPDTGRCMELRTTYPGLQFYSANHLSERLDGRAHEVYAPRCAFCLEAQGFPDAPNRPEFPSVEVRAGERVFHEIEYRFWAE